MEFYIQARIGFNKETIGGYAGFVIDCRRDFEGASGRRGSR
jgi:hypothetical protein